MKLHDEGRATRFTVADAIEVFSKHAGFSEDFHAEMRVGQIRFPNGETPYLIQMVSYDMDMAVSLPTAHYFQGTSSAGVPLRFRRLQGASVDYDGNLQLKDESWLHAVTIEPARISTELTEIELEFLHFVITQYGDFDRGYGYLGLFDVRRSPGWLDYSRLAGIKVPLLKAIEIDIRQEGSRSPRLATVSHREIGRALGKCGIRQFRSQAA